MGFVKKTVLQYYLKHLNSIIYNYGHNILRIFDVSTNFSFATGETKPDY